MWSPFFLFFFLSLSSTKWALSHATLALCMTTKHMHRHPFLPTPARATSTQTAPCRALYTTPGSWRPTTPPSVTANSKIFCERGRQRSAATFYPCYSLVLLFFFIFLMECFAWRCSHGVSPSKPSCQHPHGNGLIWPISHNPFCIDSSVMGTLIPRHVQFGKLVTRTNRGKLR